MRIETRAIVCAVLKHGEHGAVVRALTREEGLLAGYVRGGRSRALRPVLIPGNAIQGAFRARTADQLAALTVELVRSRAPLLTEPLAAMAIEWVTALAATALPEGQAYPDVYDALDGVLDAIEHAPSARGWAAAVAGYERVVLARLGYGAGTEDGELFDTLRANRTMLDENLYVDRRADILASRDRLVERLKAAIA